MARSTTSSSTPTPKITPELIRERMAQLQAAREKALADANAFIGALQDCEFWLDVLADKAP